MASTIELLGIPSGLAGLTVEVYPIGSDTIVNTGGDALTEATNRKTLYSAAIAETFAAGVHVAIVKSSGGTPIYSELVDVEAADGNTIRAIEAGLLEAIEAGGAGDTYLLAPIVGEVPERQQGVTVPLYTGEQQPTQIDVVDGNGDPVDFTAIDDDFTLTIRDSRAALVQVASTIDGTLDLADGSVSFTPDPETTTLKRRGLNYSLRRVSTDEVYQEGPMPVRFATARQEVPAP